MSFPEVNVMILNNRWYFLLLKYFQKEVETTKR
jgi:hypothetical protein